MSEYYKEAKTVLKEVMDRIEVKKNEKEDEIIEKWPSIIGEKISTYAFFDHIDKKTLYIATEDTHNTPFIVRQKKRIIEKYNACFPKDRISYIKIIVKNF